MKTYRPQRKVNAGGITGALAAVLLWVAAAAGVELDASAAVGFATVAIYVVQYIVRPGEQDKTIS